MVNETSPPAARAEIDLVLGYAPPAARAGVRALWALDRRLGDLVRAAREPMVGQMRLTWWHEALTSLAERTAPAEPVLRALADDVLPRGVTGAELAAMVEGWEVLLDPGPLGDDVLERYGVGRGSSLFRIAARVLGGEDPRVASLGAGWALADLSMNLSDPVAAARTAVLAAERLACVRGDRWPRGLRALAALAILARSDLGGGVPGSPARIGRLLAMRLTGR